MIESLLPLVGLLVIAALIAAAAAALSGDFRGFLTRLLSGESKRARAKPGPDQPRYRRRDALLTPGERAFFPVLESVLPDLAAHLGRPPMRAFAKVRLADLIEPDGPSADRSRRTTWRNKIDRKHADAVLVCAETFTPLCVVELDDRSHRAPGAQQRDADKDAALTSAGLPIARIPARAAYERRDIARILASVMKPATADPSPDHR